ncbi:MAG TPA: PQQ-binding-like beta-propeller repeat protein, partial [Candidatus Acidoferrum sp.]|nr:PQQ-binding-like beta-propeller repeat protein [Candidatus Acidoferrum sp.]
AYGLRRRSSRWLFGAVLAATALQAEAQQLDWPGFGGRSDQSKYVDYAQITPANVSKLQVAWTYKVTDNNAYQFSPVIVGETMYVLAKDNSLVALDATTGKEKWSKPGFSGISRRGITYWHTTRGEDSRLLITRNDRLIELDADSGEQIMSFGTNGEVDLRQDLGRDPESVKRVQSSSPGVIYGNLILLGSSPGEGYFSPPGHLRAYNVVTGKLAWIFHTVPQPGEYGYDTWPKDAYKYVGGANAWGDITVDTERGIAYFPLGSPTYDYYGADRLGANLFGDSLVALDAKTGKRLWHFQAVHHDLWDYDLTAAPQLLTVHRNGKEIPAVAQATKQGFLFVFDRVTGEPLYDIEEKPVPKSDMPGEQAWPTQPFSTQLPITARQGMRVEDLATIFLSKEEHAAWATRIAADRTGLFNPINTVETIGLPGGVGGTNWGNTAADPKRGILYVMNQDFPSFYRLESVEVETRKAAAGATSFMPTQVRAGESAYKLYCQACHGGDRAGGNNGPSLLGLVGNISLGELQRIVTAGQGRMPPLQHIDDTALTNLLAFVSGGSAQPFAVGAAYPPGVDAPKLQFRTDYGLGFPAIMQPPWSTLQAIDLNSGKLLWKIPLGQDKEATRAGFTGTGVPRGTQRNGMIVTSTGIVFATAKDGHVYAFDAANGKTLWSAQLPMGTEGLPAMYVIDGRQYLVVNATTPLTWGRLSRESGFGSSEPMGVGGYVVFALPK